MSSTRATTAFHDVGFIPTTLLLSHYLHTSYLPSYLLHFDCSVVGTFNFLLRRNTLVQVNIVVPRSIHTCMGILQCLPPVCTAQYYLSTSYIPLLLPTFFGFLFTLYYLPIQWEFTDSTTCTLFSSLLPLFYIPHLSVHQSYSLGESLSTYLESNFLCHNLSLHSQFLIS